MSCFLYSLACTLAVGGIALTFLPFWRHAAWWVRIWEFPRLQLVGLMVIAVVLRAASGTLYGWKDLLLGAGLALALFAQAAAIAPFTPFWRRQVLRSRRPRSERSLSLVAVNVLMDNREVGRLKRSLERMAPDIVLAVETDTWWAQQLAEMLSCTHPHVLSCPLGNTYGMVLRSRLPFVDQSLSFLLKDGIPSMRVGVRLDSGAIVDLWGVHPEPPSPTEAPTSLSRDAELILVARAIEARRRHGDERPVIVMGDLNDVAWSRTTRAFLRLSQLVDPRVGRGFYNSFHAGIWPLRWPLDHVFHSPDFVLRRLRRLPAFGSDHFPIMVELDHAPRAKTHQTPDPPRLEDRAIAAETVAAAREEAASELPLGRALDV
ncbi:endonuclease/exonuclease/phosphatase family protein [Arboricoccus pini]|uniref:endonuclease/exonuclease/phosphatase family protein n=1 Tax=Arboricoccus pini TaxID=1963835 RepID=UPI0013FDCE55|nr:endonuclease/exonuclease/phosphatase family protein [Arboricoccus pini]